MNSQPGKQEFDPFSPEADKKQRGGRSVAWLALLIALAVSAIWGWQWWQEQQLETHEAGLEQALIKLRNSQILALQSIESRLDTLEQGDVSADLTTLKTEMDRLQAELKGVSAESGTGTLELEAARAMLDELGVRVTALEDGLAAVAVRGESPGKRMDFAEVDYLLRMASERLQLFGDVKAADQVLAMADSQLEALYDPLYLPVRQSIAAARRSLSVIPELDTVLLTEKIAALQSGIPSLPFPGEVLGESHDVNATEGGEEPGIWERFKQAMSGLVTVRRRVPEDELITLEDRDYLRQGLWLQYESARLALMRRDPDGYQKALQRSSATLEDHFDSGSRQVSEAINETAELLEQRLDYQVPDISEPWARLKLLRLGRAEAIGAGSAIDTTTTPALQGEAATIEDKPGENPAQPDTGNDEGTGSG